MTGHDDDRALDALLARARADLEAWIDRTTDYDALLRDIRRRADATPPARGATSTRPPT